MFEQSTKLLAAVLAPALIASSASAAVISVDLQKDDNDVVASGAQGGTGDFDATAGTTWNKWNLGDRNSVGVIAIPATAALVTRDGSSTLNNVTVEFQAGPTVGGGGTDGKWRVRETNSPGSLSTDDVALHGDGLQIQHNNTTATAIFSGLIAGNTYDIKIHTMDRGNNTYVYTAAGPLDASPIGLSGDRVVTGFVADGSGQINFVITDNGDGRDETVGGLEISGNFLTQDVPEPGSLALLGLGGLLIARRRRG